MAATGEERQTRKVIEAAMAMGRSQLETDFICRLYENVPPFDLADLKAEDLHAAARAFLEMGRTRKPGRPAIRVSNPDYLKARANGRPAHTVVEILNDDMPFLVDSVTAEVNRQGLTVHLVMHPVLKAQRDRNGRLREILPADADAPSAAAESWMRIEVDQHSSPEAMDGLRTGLERVLADVRHAVEDWQPMLGKVHAIIDELTVSPPRLPEAEIEEAKAFLTWLADDNFTLLGYREYRISGAGAEATMSTDKASGLGILRDPDFHVFEGVREMARLPDDVRAFLTAPTLLIINKANLRSTVHRPVHFDAIGLKRFDAEGNVVGERLIVGLFTSMVYNRSPRNVPILRMKIERVLARAGFGPTSHDGKALLHILMNYPRDELFQIGHDDLFDTVMGILHLQERQRIALFARYDSFQRFVSCLVYVPRDRYSTEVREKFADILTEDFDGPVTAFYTQIADDSVLARVHFIIKTEPSDSLHRDIAATERRLVEAARTWTDRLKAALVSAHGEEAGLALFAKYADAFSVGYCADNDCDAALEDIERIEPAVESGGMRTRMYRPAGAEGTGRFRFRLFEPRGAVPLSDALPMLENMGLKVIDEIPHPVHPAGADRPVWVHDFGVETRSPGAVDPMAVREAFMETFARVCSGEVENDGFNALVLGAGLVWREVVVLRAYAKYLRQTGVPFSTVYLANTLQRQPALARLVVDLFLDRAKSRDTKTRDGILEKIEAALDGVASLDEDRIVRRFVNLVASTLRTNFHQTTAEGGHKPYLSVKLDSRAIDDLPLPRPMVEIWVYSPRVEGVHLRFGKVARGGLRWSDRHEDFRTEILGLVKAQVVKNAVIVPVGSKGGFIVKQPPAEGGREALQAEGIACYKTFIRGMLDLTDNIVDGRIAPPPDVVRHDDDDPYLVVAADKGTATFSDIANGVSREYGFWLDDAFASGGSAGYDHKAMGITARGAWEAVKRHFRELGVDIQNQPFSVVGIGDMSGDVFGNGMLLSPHIRLIAAFNHLHIFVDPDPDPARSFAERQRLFDLPRSSWSDYDASIISKGGGVFDRSAKSIRPSAEIRRRFGIERESVSPNELIRAILRAEVDLLWFGGIGTYVKSSRESHASVGDRSNDALRVDGEELRARVVGEGANLGMTQLGRIEYARRGGRLNTDAIDNSAGVDCSDHEVNIKIALGDVVARGDMTIRQRNRLLEKMTDEVADLVLRDNYLQTTAISVTERLGASALDRLTRFMRALERKGLLNREVEQLPDEDSLQERRQAGEGYTRPELSVLLAYAKIDLFDELLASDLPDDPQLEDDLIRYFPTPLQKKYREALERHRLRREIIATYTTNSIVNRAGISFVHDLEVETGLSASDIARAYAMVRDSFRLRDLWQAIEALDNKAPAKEQIEALLETGRFVKRATDWFLRNAPRPLDIQASVQRFRPGIDAFCDSLDEMLPERLAAEIDARRQRRLEAGLGEDIATRMAWQHVYISGCDVVRLASEFRRKLPIVGRLYFHIGERFSLESLREAAVAAWPEEYWDKMAISAIIDDLYGHQYSLARSVLAEDGRSPEKAFDDWQARHATVVAQTDRILEDMRSGGPIDLAILAVANRQLRALVGG